MQRCPGMSCSPAHGFVCYYSGCLGAASAVARPELSGVCWVQVFPLFSCGLSCVSPHVCVHATPLEQVWLHNVYAGTVGHCLA